MSTVSLIFFLAWMLLFTGAIGKTITDHACMTNADCGSNFGTVRIVCCLFGNGVRKCQYNGCLRYPCFTHGDCGGNGECCINNACTNNNCPQCHTNINCAVSEYCCGRGILTNVCRRSCVGELCIADSDCSGPGEYCNSDHKCAKLISSSTQLPCWGILLITTGLVVVFLIISVCLYCRCFKRKTYRNDALNTEGNDNTNIMLDEANTHTTRLPTNSPSHYDHMERENPPPYHSQGHKFKHVDSDGYELPKRQ